MTKNRLLNIAIGICRLIKICYLFLFILLTIFFIHFQVDREFYKNNETSFNHKPNGIIHFSKHIKWKMINAGEDEKVFTLHKISTISFYVIYFQLIGILLFLFLSTKEFQTVMLSVKNLKTFRRKNMVSFKKIGKYIIGYFLLTSYVSIRFKEGGISGYYISLTPLIFVLFAFIMAEIFKEGNYLEEENELTI